ncbi:MAG: hypothetical protein EPO10_02870 [Reyranella sp.]|uniref:hypothetical protein n=1 Tax=Reyranella sp. TaxID=1929291 RepID=UPI0012140A86|nr:hypothetical protein [Reyranella sp.]TAJ95631.1 MAG: hypothetical protein EPO41_10410 [Reyranella sp.]TBR30434.1 MAG: hypothetical protein EPO10_02870 [Reyranella sp.]
MKPPPPPGPPDVAELQDLIDQWAGFAQDLERQDYSFDLDNWLNDVDVRELILEALPMFSREEMGDHALKLDAADRIFMAATRDFKRCVWGHGTARKENWTPQKNWWYFRTPARSNAQLEDELATVR